MEKEYVLKTDNFYLSKYFLDPNKPETNFISGVIFATNINTALKLTIEKAKYLNKMFYIEIGLDFEVKEVEK